MALPKAPLTRTEQYLQRIATGYGTIPQAPLTRLEQYLSYICAQHGMFEVINDVTYDGNTPFAITKDHNGKVFNLKKSILVISNGSAETAGQATFRFKCGTTTLYEAHAEYPENKAGRLMFAKAFSENGFWLGEHTSFNDNGFGTLFTKIGAIDSWISKTELTYPYIDSVSASWTPPRETRAVLLGVRV